MQASRHRVLGKIAERHDTGAVYELARGPGYRITDMHCWMGPRDIARENAFPAFRVAAVIDGSFAIRSPLGTGVAVAGALLMGNACECYCCRHDSAAGDRCINFDFEPEFLERVRSAVGARHAREQFQHLLVAPSLRSAALAAVAEGIADGDTGSLHEAALEVAAAAVTATQDPVAQGGRRASLRDERRIMRAARYAQEHFDRRCTLEDLAAEAGLSAFHFLRTFRRVIGQTPHRYVLATRLRHAARRLRTTDQRVVDVAAGVGFGDLSNFNASFARVFAMSPRQYRARGCQGRRRVPS